jgi:hypothetical protein
MHYTKIHKNSSILHHLRYRYREMSGALSYRSFHMQLLKVLSDGAVIIACAKKICPNHRI